VSDFAVEAEGLVKSFPGGVVAVDGLDLSVPRGCVYGLIGRNGAGKTTTLRLLAGLLRPERGSVRLLGADPLKASAEERARVAYVSQQQRLHGWMSTDEHAEYVRHFYPRWDGDFAARLAERFEIPRDRRIGELSGGQQRKAAILLALAARTDVILLDEPAGGLDPIARRDLVNEIIDVVSSGDGTTVLLSTHIISDLERVAEYVGILDEGRLIESGRLDELQGSARRVQVIFEGAPPADFEIPGAVRSTREGSVVSAVARIADDAALDPVRRIPGARVQVFPLGLEDFYIELFGARED
jgi:ABC-2 type transport system ATP-binding protein